MGWIDSLEAIPVLGKHSLIQLQNDEEHAFHSQQKNETGFEL